MSTRSTTTTKLSASCTRADSSKQFPRQSRACVGCNTGQSAATNRWRFDHARIVLQCGDKQRALELHKEVLEARLKRHGKFGLLTFQSYYAVGAAHRWLGHLKDAEQYIRKIIATDQNRPGICTEAGLAQAQFNLSSILAIRLDDPGIGEGESRLPDAGVTARLEESALLAHRARRVLKKPHSLGPLKTVQPKGMGRRQC